MYGIDNVQVFHSNKSFWRFYDHHFSPIRDELKSSVILSNNIFVASQTQAHY